MANKYLYQVHESGGEWEYHYDRVVSTFYSEYKANNLLNKLKEDFKKEVIKAKKCATCNHDEACFCPYDSNIKDCMNEFWLFDNDIKFEVKQIEVADWDNN